MKTQAKVIVKRQLPGEGQPTEEPTRVSKNDQVRQGNLQSYKGKKKETPRYQITNPAHVQRSTPQVNDKAKELIIISNTITPLITSSNNENYIKLRTSHLQKHHYNKLTMHSALFVSVTYLGLTCCRNGSHTLAAPSPSCSCSKLLLLADLKISPVPPSQR